MCVFRNKGFFRDSSMPIRREFDVMIRSKSIRELSLDPDPTTYYLCKTALPLITSVLSYIKWG